jgi:hypothetical protein
MKHPPRQYSDDEAYRMTEAFIQGNWAKMADEKADHRHPRGQQVVAKG